MTTLSGSTFNNNLFITRFKDDTPNPVYGRKSDPSIESNDISKPLDNLWGFDIYPNPNDGKFFINLQYEGDKDVTIKISDVSGRIIYERFFNHVPASNIELEITNQVNGVYFIQIQLDDKIEVRKIFIDR